MNVSRNLSNIWKNTGRIGLSEKVKNMGAFDQAIKNLQNELWQIADKYGSDGASVFAEYMTWRNKRQK